MNNYGEVPLPDKLKAITDAFEWASGSFVKWDKQKDSPRAREANRSWIELSIMRLKDLGRDERKYDDEVVYQVGQKLLMLQVKVRSRSQDFADFAFLKAEKTKTRIQMDFVKNTWLGPNDMSVAEVTDVIDMPDGFVHDNRVEDVAVFELHLNTFMSETDEANSMYFIENIELTSNFKNAGGVPTDTSLQLDKEVI